VIVQAGWTINEYIVTFVSSTGLVLKTETVAYGGAATAPATGDVPTIRGYTFN